MTFEQDAETLRNACVGVRIVGGSHTAVEDALERVLRDARRYQARREATRWRGENSIEQDDAWYDRRSDELIAAQEKK